MSELIEDCRFNSENNSATFYKWGKTINIKDDEISILNIIDEADAHNITGMIKNLIGNSYGEIIESSN